MAVTGTDVPKNVMDDLRERLRGQIEEILRAEGERIVEGAIKQLRSDVMARTAQAAHNLAQGLHIKERFGYPEITFHVIIPVKE